MSLLLLPLLVLPLLLHLIAPGRATDPAWRWRAELPLALACGLAVGGLSALWLARFYLLDGAHLTSDFTEYCEAVIVRSRGDLQNFTRNRSLLQAWPSALLLPRLGLIDAMTAAGGLSVCVMGSGLYLWGRALHGRLAGVCAALSACALTPLVLLSRTMSFYPEITAALTLAAGLAAVAARVRTPLALAAGSAGAALCLLIDLRGLIFAIPFLGIVTLAALAAPPRRWLARLAIPAAAIGLAWGLAGHAYLPQTASLEGQVFLRQRLEDRGIPVPPELESLLPTEYVWGRSDPRQIPQTLLGLQRQSAAAPAALRQSAETEANIESFIRPWTLPVGGAALIALIGILARPGRGWRLVVLLGTCAPFAVSLRGAIDIQQAFLRFVASGEPWLAVLLGVGFATLAEGGPRTGQVGGRGALRAALAAAVLFLLIMGAIPSHVSPMAPWRVEVGRSDREVLRVIDGARRGNPRHAPVCVQQLINEIEAGGTIEGRLHGGVQPKPRRGGR